jgi:hypothetical protein
MSPLTLVCYRYMPFTLRARRTPNILLQNLPTTALACQMSFSFSIKVRVTYNVLLAVPGDRHVRPKSERANVL